MLEAGTCEQCAMQCIRDPRKALASRSFWAGYRGRASLTSSWKSDSEKMIAKDWESSVWYTVQPILVILKSFRRLRR